MMKIDSQATEAKKSTIRSKLNEIIKLPRWAWTVSGMPGMRPENIAKPFYARWSLIIAFKLRRIYNPLMSYRVVLLTLIAFVLCYFLPERHTGWNHIFVISSSVASTQVLTVIIGALAAVLAVIFSIVLLVVGVLRNYAYRGKLSDLFSYYPLRELLLFYGTVVATSLYALATTQDTLSIRNIHLLYLEMYLFFTAIVALYPAMKKLIDFTDPVATAPRYIKEINANVASYGRFSITGDSEIIPAQEGHAIFALRDLAIKALSENDEVTTIQIIEAMSGRLSELLEKEESPDKRRLIIDAFLLVWRSLMLRAIRLESEGVLLCILDAIKTINLDILKRKDAKWVEPLELNRFHAELINKALEAGYDEVATRGIYLLGGIFEWNVPNIPPANDLFMYWSRKRQATDKGDTDKELKWEHLTGDFIRLLTGVSSAAVKNGNEAAVRGVIFNLGSLIPKIESAEQLSDKQKGAIISQISWAIRECSLEAIDKLSISRFFIPGLDDYTYKDVMVSNKEYSKFPIVYYKDIYRKAISKNVLTGFALDSLRMASFTLTDKLKRGNFDKTRKILFYLVTILDDIRSKTEHCSTEQAIECYLAAHDKLKSIQKIVKDLNDDELDNSIKESLKKFKNVTRLRNTQSRYDDLW